MEKIIIGIGNYKLENGNEKIENRKYIKEIGNSEIGIRNWKLENAEQKVEL